MTADTGDGGAAGDGSTRAWLPEHFTAPAGLVGDRYKLARLGVEHAERDYEAVMETQQRLRRGSPSGWPREGFTLDENRADLLRHSTEFDSRSAFAYSVLSLDETRVLGCVYINPTSTSEPADADATVYLWVRESEYPGGLALDLYRTMDTWLREDWPLDSINYVRTAYYRLQGRCLCGLVSFEVDELCGPFELCHCSRCRRVSGSAFAAGVTVSAVYFHQGADLVTTVVLPIRERPPAYQHSFCQRCGSPVPDPTNSATQEIAAGCLDDLPRNPDRHIYVEGKAAWYAIADKTPQFTGQAIGELRRRHG